jgi:hypothetical protein
MSREEAAAKAMVDLSVKWQTTESSELAQAALDAADAHDLANGIHRIALDDATVERAADILLQGDMGMCECRRSPFDKHDVNPPCSTRKDAIAKMRRVLAAAVKEEQA